MLCVGGFRGGAGMNRRSEGGRARGRPGGGARACGRPRLTAYVVPWAPGRACGGAAREGADERNRGLLLLLLRCCGPGAFRGGAGMNR